MTAGAVAAAALVRTESRGCHTVSTTLTPTGIGAQPGAGCDVLMELNADELTEAPQGDRVRSGRRPALGPDVTTLADGGRRRYDHRLDGDP